MKYIAHGVTLTGFMLEFEADPKQDPTTIWNEAVAATEQTPWKIQEQTTRLSKVHPATVMCGLCPPDVPEQTVKAPGTRIGPNVDGAPGKPLPRDDHDREERRIAGEVQQKPASERRRG